MYFKKYIKKIITFDIIVLLINILPFKTTQKEITFSINSIAFAPDDILHVLILIL